MKSIIVLLVTFIFSTSAFAAKGGGGGGAWSMGLGLTQISAAQGDLNELQKRANTRAGISTAALSNAYEFIVFMERRFGSVFALHVRPSYFTQSTTGTGGTGATAGTYAYSVSGFAIVPMLRAYILESKAVHLYMQGGVGWGYLSGKIQEGPASADFAGSNIGFQGGLGVEFCLGSATHCFFGEGNVRYLFVERNIVKSRGGTFAADSATGGAGEELEINGRDLGTTMSGVQALLGYAFHF